jgi:uncharacterized protein (TIGR02271 family)
MMLDEQRIVAAAVRFIDERGLRELTMRRLGAYLGVEGMALYRYVPGREALLDAVVESVVDELYSDPDVLLEAPAGWVDYLQRLAHGLRRIALAHPEVFPLVATRPPAAGFSDADAAAVYRAFSSFLLGHLLLEVSALGVETGPVEEPEVEPAHDLSAYPLLRRLEPHLSQDHSDVYLDAQTGDPEWVAVKTGLFGTKQSFVPLDRATLEGARIVVAFSKNQVKDAPRIDPDGRLSPAEEDELYRYYGLPSTDGNLDRSDDRGDTSGRDTDDAMTRSEERLIAGTRTEEAGRARLRKYVVTEQEQVSVPVTREEVRLEREPITEANRGAALGGPAISEEEHEVTLHAERPVVETEAVPVERVRLGKETVTGQERVQGEVRKEQIDFDDAAGRAGR